MKKTTALWLIAAVSLIVVGSLIFGGVMAMLKWDFAGLSTGQYETNEYEIKESFSSISIDSDTADIVLVPSQGETVSVVCHEEKNRNHTVTVENGTLLIKVVDTRKWYEHIGIHFEKTKITLSLPSGEYDSLSIRSATGAVNIPSDFQFQSMDVSQSTGSVTSRASVLGNVKIATTTGSICLENASLASLELSVSTGSVRISNLQCAGDAVIRTTTGSVEVRDMTCRNMTTDGSTGSVSLCRVIAAEAFSIERSTGSVRFEDADAAEIFVKTSTGSVVGSLRSEKLFLASSNTGSVDVPATEAGGRCEIKTSTGNIRITVG